MLGTITNYAGERAMLWAPSYAANSEYASMLEDEYAEDVQRFGEHRALAVLPLARLRA